MIPIDWLAVLPLSALIPAAYWIGKYQERGRCELIAHQEAGRAHLHEEARTASRIAGLISKDLQAPSLDSGEKR